MDDDKSEMITITYTRCNIILHWPEYKPIKSRWLASMGMLDTLVIMGINAGIWNVYNND